MYVAGQVTVTLCTEELFLSTQYIHIALSASQRVNMGGGEDMDSQHDTFCGPAGSYTSQADLIKGYRVSDKTECFCTIIL